MPEEPLAPSDRAVPPSDPSASASSAADEEPAAQPEGGEAAAAEGEVTASAEAAEANVSPAPAAASGGDDNSPTAPADPAASGGDDNNPTAPADPGTDEFAAMLQASGATPREVAVGERIRGKIASIGDDFAFVDFGGRGEARIATSELRGPEGKVLMRTGDSLTATVSEAEDGVVLTLGRRRGVVLAARLRVAFEKEIPVRGTVKAVNKGGFDVQIGGIRTFCPLSQIDATFVDDPQTHVGKSYPFRVLRWEQGGRNIVVSRRVLLERDNAEKALETRKKLAVDAELDGVVTRVQPFGAFVDLGGLEGLLHISRMGHGHIDDPKEVVQPGQKVRVRVVKIENEGKKKERIALALADLGPDPWDDLAANLPEGEIVSGKVARITSFGAFVSLETGIDGLVHVSELAGRTTDPKQALSVGQEVQVKILHVDRDKRRVSLSMRTQDDPASRPARREGRREGRRDARRDTRRPRRPEPGATGSSALTHTMADQLGALKDKLEGS